MACMLGAPRSATRFATDARGRGLENRFSINTRITSRLSRPGRARRDPAGCPIVARRIVPLALAPWPGGDDTADTRDPPARGGPRDGLARPHGGDGPPTDTNAAYVPASLGRPTLAMVANLKYPESLEVVAAARHRSMVADCAILLADANAFVEREYAYERLLAERRIDGLLMATFMPTTSAIAAIARHGLPVVLVGRRIPWLVPGVSVDDEAGMGVAVDYLAGLGHRRIGYVAGPGEADTVHRRLDGFRRAMQRSCLAVARPCRDVDRGSARRARSCRPPPARTTPQPTAVVLWSIGDAAGALVAVREPRPQVPQDLSSWWPSTTRRPAAFLSPPLTACGCRCGSWRRGRQPGSSAP